mmetsp:Transcript_21779/g.67540  ORF Transcript_21779/g.67540 Transcript_21779/m.67540 type:complete len:295 (+) Transcript_21779:1130-2014(+)
MQPARRLPDSTKKFGGRAERARRNGLVRTLPHAEELVGATSELVVCCAHAGGGRCQPLIFTRRGRRAPKGVELRRVGGGEGGEAVEQAQLLLHIHAVVRGRRIRADSDGRASVEPCRHGRREGEERVREGARDERVACGTEERNIGARRKVRVHEHQRQARVEDAELGEMSQGAKSARSRTDRVKLVDGLADVRVDGQPAALVRESDGARPQRIAHRVRRVRAQRGEDAALAQRVVGGNRGGVGERALKPRHAGPIKVLQSGRDNAGKARINERVGKRAPVVVVLPHEPDAAEQ